jgi:hypothetical protein
MSIVCYFPERWSSIVECEEAKAKRRLMRLHNGYDRCQRYRLFVSAGSRDMREMEEKAVNRYNTGKGRLDLM